MTNVLSSLFMKQINTINVESHFSPFYCDYIISEIISHFYNKTNNLIIEIDNFINKYELIKDEFFDIEKNILFRDKRNIYKKYFPKPFIFDTTQNNINNYLLEISNNKYEQIENDIEINKFSNLSTFDNKNNVLLDFFILNYILYKDTYYHFFENLIDKNNLFILPVYIDGMEVNDLKSYFEHNTFTRLRKNKDKMGPNQDVSYYKRLNIYFNLYLKSKFPNTSVKYSQELPFIVGDGLEQDNLQYCQNIFYLKSLYRTTNTRIKKKEIMIKYL